MKDKTDEEEQMEDDDEEINISSEKIEEGPKGKLPLKKIDENPEKKFKTS